MRKWVQKTAGLILSAFLTLGLGSRVHAADEGETLPAPMPTEAIAPAEAAPIEETKPDETATVEETKPDEAATVEETKPDEAITVEETKPAETATVDETKPVEAATVEETKPAETTTVEEAKPNEATAVEETKPAETATVDETKPTETATVDETKPVEAVTVDETKPAETATVDETKPAETTTVEKAKPAEAITVEEAKPDEAVTVKEAKPDEAASLLVNAPLRNNPARAGSDAPEETASPSRSLSGSEGQELSAEILIDGKDVSERDGWSYSEATGQVGLVNFNHPETSIVSSGPGGLAIAASGFNRLRSIISEGHVNVTGTGLLLLDSVILGENSGFYLHTPLDIYRDGTGSVAVFLKSGEKQYTLVNGGVAGLLDEQYSVTDVDLVVPDGSTLFLNSGGTVYDKDTHEIVFRYTGDEGPALAQEHGVTASPIEEDCSHGIDETHGSLTIGDGASLTVKGGGTIRMQSTQGIKSWADISAPTLTAENDGAIVIDGAVTGDGRIKLGENSSLSGSGTAEADEITVGSPRVLSDCGVKLRADEVWINGSGTISNLILDNSNVFPGSSGAAVAVSNLVNSGDSSIINRGTLTLGSVDNTGSLTLFSDAEYPSAGSVFDLGGVVSGGTLRLTGGVFHLRDRFALRNDAVMSCDHVIVYDHVGSSASFEAPLIVSPRQVTMPTLTDGRYEVPLVIVKADYTTSHARGTEILSTQVSRVYFTRNDAGNYVLDLGNASSYEGGKNLLAALLEGDDSLFRVIVELQCLDRNGDLRFESESYVVSELDLKKDPPTFALGGAYLVRITVSREFPFLPSATLTSTSVSFTGTGILGGSGGSLAAGGGTVLFRGSAYSHQDPDPSDPDPTDPSDTDPTDPSDTDPTGPSDTDPTDPSDPDPTDPPGPSDVTPDPVAPSPAAAGAQTSALSWRVVIDESGDYRIVTAYHGTQEVSEPDRMLTVHMKFSLPAGWDGRTIYAVFRNADGTLTAIKARYNPLTGILSFDTELAGIFALVSFPYDGEPFSREFFAALEELEIIRKLPARR